MSDVYGSGRWKEAWKASGHALCHFRGRAGWLWASDSRWRLAWVESGALKRIPHMVHQSLLPRFASVPNHPPTPCSSLLRKVVCHVSIICHSSKVVYALVLIHLEWGLCLRASLRHLGSSLKRPVGLWTTKLHAQAGAASCFDSQVVLEPCTRLCIMCPIVLPFPRISQ